MGHSFPSINEAQVKSLDYSPAFQYGHEKSFQLAENYVLHTKITKPYILYKCCFCVSGYLPLPHTQVLIIELPKDMSEKGNKRADDSLSVIAIHDSSNIDAVIIALMSIVAGVIIPTQG